MKIIVSSIILFSSTSVIGGELRGVLLGVSCEEVIRLESERGSERQSTELENIVFKLKYHGSDALAMYSCDKKKRVQSIDLSVFFSDSVTAEKYFIDQSSMLTKQIGNRSFDLHEALRKKSMKKTEWNDRLWCPKGESVILSVGPFGPDRWYVSKTISSHTAVCNKTPSPSRPTSLTPGLNR